MKNRYDVPWVALVLVVFLFYYLVKREHKILLFKYFGILSIICLLGIFSYAGYRKWNAIREKSWLEITVLPQKTDSKLHGLALLAATNTGIECEICNKRSVELESCNFTVGGFESGRSTAHRLTKGYPADFSHRYDDGTWLNSDFIIPAGECKKLEYSNEDFQIFNRYEVISMSGTWKE